MSTLHQRAVLIERATVCHLTGLRRDEVYERVDGASLLHGAFVWVWNFASAADGIKRDLRFWAREIVAPETVKGLKLAQVVDMVLPKARKHFHAGELAHWFSLSRPGLKALREDLGGHKESVITTFYDRAGVADFLRRRWCGQITQEKA